MKELVNEDQSNLFYIVVMERVLKEIEDFNDKSLFTHTEVN